MNNTSDPLLLNKLISFCIHNFAVDCRLVCAACRYWSSDDSNKVCRNVNFVSLMAISLSISYNYLYIDAWLCTENEFFYWKCFRRYQSWMESYKFCFIQWLRLYYKTSRVYETMLQSCQKQNEGAERKRVSAFLCSSKRKWGCSQSIRWTMKRLLRQPVIATYSSVCGCIL